MADTTVPYSTNDSKIVDATIAEMRELAARYPQGRSALLPMLHLVQSVEGRITPEGIEACAAVLGLTGAEVSAVATFYTMYKRRPVGDYHVGVCTNTLCAVMGGDLIFERLKSHLDVGNDETTEDGKITLEHLECNAACDYAPVMMVNWEFFDDMTPESAAELVDDLRDDAKEVKSPRGATICTWKEAERVLAGFPDGRADEGPTGGKATLAGLRLARERNWTAPEGTHSRSSNGHAAEQTVSADAAAGPRPEDQPGKESGTGSPATPDSRKED
ncbi:NADH-quinone oxidoreductase subunit NuoE [Streptomyces sp. SID13031]|uniref:NADH-quinone oxidoreductase subunit NuoE n=1 Tax=Streptomyces sp. SID13031 TaxID=2706046 RepID=UPI0013C64EE7|nr:NADH-quinone oxidoreductase subunit NuoE [Streptomyces sp. SID13031]NEA36289.1 NADH-quinone oxidoreductase subunit NuoE [Streptomyces sp. SID13031]